MESAETWFISQTVTGMFCSSTDGSYLVTALDSASNDVHSSRNVLEDRRHLNVAVTISAMVEDRITSDEVRSESSQDIGQLLVNPSNVLIKQSLAKSDTIHPIQEETDCKLLKSNLPSNLCASQQVVDDTNEPIIQAVAGIKLQLSDDISNINVGINTSVRCENTAGTYPGIIDSIAIRSVSHSIDLSETSCKELDTAGVDMATGQGLNLYPTPRKAKFYSSEASFVSLVPVTFDRANKHRSIDEVQQNLAFEDNTDHEKVEDFSDTTEDYIDGKNDYFDDNEAAYKIHTTSLKVGGTISTDRNMADFQAVTSAEQFGEEASSSLQSDIKEHTLKSSYARDETCVGSTLNVSTPDGQAAVDNVFLWLDRQAWALDYHKDPRKNCIVIGVNNIDWAEARRQVMGIDDRLLYVVQWSSVIGVKYVDCSKSEDKISLRTSSVIKSEHKEALLGGVLVNPQNHEKYGVTVGHLFENVNEGCWNKDGKKIGVCRRRKVFTNADQQSGKPFVDIALVELQAYSVDENVFPDIPHPSSQPSAAAGVQWELRLDRPKGCGLTKLIVLTKDGQWKRGVVSVIDDCFKLPDSNGEVKLFKHAMRIQSSEYESKAITDIGDSGALVILDPFESAPSTSLTVVGLVVGMAHDKTFTVAISAVDSLNEINVSWKDWRFFLPTVKEPEVHDSGMYSMLDN